jgi:predicted ATP-grasp superfamily ATP-dependent carboligase
LAHDILILGASVRAAAFSALRGGFTPTCADLFADQDLVAVCPTRGIDHRNFTDQFAAVADSWAPSRWFYTGGFENRPDLVDQISKKHRLWGIDGEALRAIRDPIRVARELKQAGIPCPKSTRAANGCPRDGSWLIKPLHSAGGKGIRPLMEAGSFRLGSRYLQQRLKGPSFSALYIGTPRQVRLVGITRQLIGTPSCPFAYRGSIGPLPAPASISARLKALGSALTSTFGLIGWFGVDYVLNRGIPWPVEINPRYTASVEIHELFLGRSLLCDHRRACEGTSDESDRAEIAAGPPRPVFGKLIVYAPRPLVVPQCLRIAKEFRELFAVNSIADVPWPGASIDVGQPIMTLLARAPTVAACRKRLVRLEQKWLNRLGIAADMPV